VYTVPSIGGVIMSKDLEPLDCTIRVYATKTMKQQIRKMSKKHGVSAGAIARQALHDYLFKAENK
jgi:hypothetical protein